jgi:two-component system, NarL family, sensor kinase
MKPLLTAIVMLALAAAFVSLRLASPSDGTRIRAGAGGWAADGVVVELIDDAAGGLRDGDRVVAIGGRGLASLATETLAFDGGARDSRTIYTVVRDGELLDVPVQLGRYPARAALADAWGPLLFVVIAFLLGGFVFARKRADPAARALFLWGASGLSASGWFLGLQPADLAGGSLFWLYKATTFGTYMLYWVAALHFALIFPQRNPLVKRRPWLIPALYASPYLAYGLAVTALGWVSTTSLEWLGFAVWVEDLLAALYLVAAIGATAWSWRAARDPQAWQKARWVLAGSLLSGGGALLLWVLPAALFENARVDSNLIGLVAVPFPIALAVAILRHRLFDIDILINRALVYSLLTAALLAFYVAGVTTVQYLLDSLARHRLPEVAVAISTLGSAALFSPLQRRIQLLIDRRFYRRKYDAARTVAAFGARMRSAIDLGAVQADLVETVEEALRPDGATLWLREPRRRR